MKGVERCRFPVIKLLCPGDVMNNMVTIFNNTILHIRKVWRINLKRPLSQEKRFCNYVDRLTAVILLKYMQISNYVLHLKVICYMSIIPQYKPKKTTWATEVSKFW